MTNTEYEQGGYDIGDYSSDFSSNFWMGTSAEKTETIDAFCDCCDAQAEGTIEELQSRGWGFGGGSEFCPTCNAG